MGEVWLLAVVALVGVAVGAAAMLAARVTERERRAGAPPPPTGGMDDDVLAVLSVLPQIVIVLEADDEVLRASPAAHSFGLVRADALAHPELRALVAGLRRDGRIRDQEVLLARGPVSGAGTLTMQVRVAPLKAGRVLVLVADRTKERRVEEMRRDFTANVSHELKTPVGALALLAETVAEAADDPGTVRRFAEQMRTEARRLGDLVQEIIELSRLQEPDALAGSAPVAVDDVVAEAVARVEVEARSRHVTLVRGGTPGLQVYGDAALLTTAVRNLLDNAVRHSPPASRVSVGVSSRDALVRIAVVDQGEGIPADQRERVFERFFRGDEARSRQTGGSGLGLSIVKHVVRDHGGDVELWSTEGKGSTFTLVLPEARGPVPAGEPAEAGQPAGAEPPAGAGQPAVAEQQDAAGRPGTPERRTPAPEEVP
ncbi:ATP-binding protein [Georgenia sp. TF02-10]|uniref:sensor histidine kinase n=1 Tax=Georgenia sp. TF02-10 TaxID=2917725 RepID=UPI001FA6E770|nr:ATP-binding protein [Georgenia sp. TF02-10]UNX55268.1 ATP-binding protein [Georgenia sp. TF02-10]